MILAYVDHVMATGHAVDSGEGRERLLDLVLRAQADAARVLSATEIERSARAVVQFALAEGAPLLVPASPMAQRLIGAALLLSGGALRAGDDGFIPAGENLLLVEAVAVGTAGLLNQRELLMGLGATSVAIAALGLLVDQGQDVHILLTDPTEST